MKANTFRRPGNKYGEDHKWFLKLPRASSASEINFILALAKFLITGKGITPFSLVSNEKCESEKHTLFPMTKLTFVLHYFL